MIPRLPCTVVRLLPTGFSDQTPRSLKLPVMSRKLMVVWIKNLPALPVSNKVTPFAKLVTSALLPGRPHPQVPHAKAAGCTPRIAVAAIAARAKGGRMAMATLSFQNHLEHRPNARLSPRRATRRQRPRRGGRKLRWAKEFSP
ncbi:hypothetical protein D3C86_1425690 [compost metagenome]